MFIPKKGKAVKPIRFVCIARRDADGRVITKPPNFVTKGPKMGKDESVYFQRASYNCRGDLYKSRSEAVLRTADTDRKSAY